VPDAPAPLGKRGVEKSLDTARTSACATRPSLVCSLLIAVNVFERCVDRPRHPLPSPAFGHVRPAAALADRARLRDPPPTSLPACTLAGEVLGDSGHNGDVAFLARSQHDHRDFHLLRSESASERICWRSIPSSRAAQQPWTPFSVRALRFPTRAGRGLRQFLLQLLELMFERAFIGEQFGYVIGKLGLGSVNDFGNAAQGAGGFLKLAQRASSPVIGFNAADTGGECCPHRRSCRGRCRRCAGRGFPPQKSWLKPGSTLNDADLLAVFFAEQTP